MSYSTLSLLEGAACDGDYGCDLLGIRGVGKAGAVTVVRRGKGIL